MQFKLVNSAIEKLWSKVLVDDCVVNNISNENIRWKFIVERAPWMGSFYKRLMGLTKHCMKRSLGKVCLTFSYR